MIKASVNLFFFFFKNKIFIFLLVLFFLFFPYNNFINLDFYFTILF